MLVLNVYGETRMLIDPNDFALAVIVAFGLGIVAGIIWGTICDRQASKGKHNA